MCTPEAKEEVKRRFLREARAACAVRHPNVVQIHDVLDWGALLVSRGQQLERACYSSRRQPGSSQSLETCRDLGGHSPVQHALDAA